jgi:adenylate cyclase
MPRTSLTIVLVLAALALLETLALRSLSGLEHRLQDKLVERHALTRTPDPDVILVAIDERSLEAMAPDFGRFPWARSVVAEMVAQLHRAGARAIVVDIVFAEPDVGREADDAFLIETAIATPNAFFPMVRLENADDSQGLDLDEWGEKLGFTRTAAAQPGARVALLLPFQGIAETGRIGAINFLRDEDGVGRRYHVRLEHAGWQIASLPAKVVAALGLPVPDAPAIEIHWRGGAETRTRISFSDLFADLSRETPERYGEAVRGKIVVIGAAAAGLTDIRTSAISPSHAGPDILAGAIETLKHGDALRRLPRAFDALLALAGIAFVVGLFLTRFGPVPIAGALLLATPLAVGAAYGALSAGWIVPVVTPLAFAWLTYLARTVREYLRQRAEKQKAVRAFGRFVDPRVVQTLVGHVGDPRETKGQSRVISLLFSDIRGFTTLSESRRPEEVVEILNRYFSKQVEVIFRHGGTVDKFIGDAIMAFWGAPVDDARHAQNAVKAALEMARVVDEFRATLPGELSREFDIGIGVHTGPAVVGFIGSENKLDYTAIGDSVNLASRIEGATKGVARILVSGATRSACGEDFMFTDKGAFKAKGKSEEVRLFEPAEPAEVSRA